MSNVLEYARPRRRPSVFREPEAAMACGVGVLAIMGVSGAARLLLPDYAGAVVGVFICGAALILTLVFTACAGVVVAYDGPPSVTARRRAWAVLGIVIGNLLVVGAVVGWAVIVHG